MEQVGDVGAWRVKAGGCGRVVARGALAHHLREHAAACARFSVLDRRCTPCYNVCVVYHNVIVIVIVVT